MGEHFKFIGTLRCRTWHTWPAPEAFQQSNISFFDGSVRRHAYLAVLSYVQRGTPELYPDDETERGPLLWDGKIPNLHGIRNQILKDPSDVIPVELKLRKPFRGEVDICVQFLLDGELTPSVVESVRAVASSTMALLNLQLGDHLVPSAPFQVTKVLDTGERQMDSTVYFGIAKRSALNSSDVLPVLAQFGQLLQDGRHGDRMLIALELYAAHFAETQARIRFLLLVIAMETLARPTAKHQATLSLLERWQEQLQRELNEHTPGDDAHESLLALGREMFHRKVDSIRSQVRNLFAEIGNSADESKALRKRALRVYDKRSTLVHEGSLPGEELKTLEDEARALLELAFKKSIENLGELNVS